ncbi:DUF485 domain-containing protein [Pseudomonas citri]|uniref:DUF485 domain-containing protein n=1 Tax=Pseudomonas citri TaxID=2978349 RepID=UPI0021B5CB92|nr:DUF485 domain-containing protein [Pseudomonas citri]
MNPTTESERVRNHPRYKELISRQRTFVALLSAATLVPYIAFILVCAFAPHLLALKLSATSMINIGWPLGVIFVVGVWLFTGLYILRANGEFDELAAQIRAEATV